MVDAARQHGYAAYVGDGANRWSAVARRDAATLYRLGLEQGAAGSVFHGVGEEGVALRDIATAIGEGLGLPVRSLTPAEAPGFFGFLATFAALDSPASSQRTRDALGWQPNGPGLIKDIRAHYLG